jgi:hypothetical protein
MNVHACAHALVKLRTDDADQAWWACATCETPFAPVIRAAESAASASPEPLSDHCKIEELVRRLGGVYEVGTIRNLMSAGKLVRGVHYVKKNNGRVIFIWSAVKAWVEEDIRRTGASG